MKKVTVRKKETNTAHSSPYLQLTICVIIDILGFASYLFPGGGELSDFIYAPLSGFVLYKLFYKQNSKLAKIGGLIQGLEEILPMTDFLPTATILWMIQNKDQLFKK